MTMDVDNEACSTMGGEKEVCLNTKMSYRGMVVLPKREEVMPSILAPHVSRCILLRMPARRSVLAFKTNRHEHCDGSCKRHMQSVMVDFACVTDHLLNSIKASSAGST